MLWHEHVRRSAKLLITGCLHYSGMLAPIRRRYTRGRASILMYHRVCSPGEGVQDYSPNGISVTPSEFRMQMQFLRRHYDIVPLDRVVAAVRGEQPLTPAMCAITFDDGWRDVYQHAYPVLRELSIPATIFLTPGFATGAQWFWEERAKYLLALIHGCLASSRVSTASPVAERLAHHGFDDLLTVGRAHLPMYLGDVARRLKALEMPRRNSVMEMLETLAVELAPEALRPFLNAAEIREMASCGIEFANHTFSHPNLTELSAEGIRDEIASAAAWLAREVPQASRHFAYPYGKYDARVRSAVEALGMRSACTTRLGMVEQNADPLALNRFNMCSDVVGLEPLFAARLLGF